MPLQTATAHAGDRGHNGFNGKLPHNKYAGTASGHLSQGLSPQLIYRLEDYWDEIRVKEESPVLIPARGTETEDQRIDPPTRPGSRAEVVACPLTNSLCTVSTEEHET